MAQWPQVDVIGKVDDHGDGSGIQGEHNSQDLNEKLKGAAYDGSDGDRKWKKWVGVESGWSSDQRRRYQCRVLLVLTLKRVDVPEWR